MGAVELRNKIIQLLNTDNVGYLKDIFEFAEQKKKTSSVEDVVAYTIQGEPVTESQYVDNNIQAVSSFKKGNFKSQSQIREKYQVK